MSNSERQAFFDSYIDEVAGRYAGQLQSWDVVNEPFWPGHKAPGGYRLGPWYDAFGTDYIRRAFARAGAVDKKTKLVLNEAQAERDDDVGLAVRAGLLRLVDELQHAGVRLDVVGLQGHLQPRYPHDPQRFLEFVHALAERKVDIYITEFDVRDDTFPDDVATRDKMIAETGGEIPRDGAAGPGGQGRDRVAAVRSLFILYGRREKEESSRRTTATAAAVR